MTLRKGLISASLVVFATQTHAMPGTLSSGSNLVSRGGYTPSLPYSSASNPASLVKLLGDQRIDIGGFSLPLLALEIGDVDNLGDRFDALEEALDDIESDDSAGGEAVTPAEADAVKPQFDDFVDELDDDAFLNVDVSLPAPALPIIFKALDGVVAVNLEASANVRISGLGGELLYDDVNQELSTDTAVYVRSGEFVQADISYGQEPMLLTLFNQTFDFGVGGRLKVTRGALSRQVIALDDDSDDDDDSAFDRAGDNYDNNKQTTTAIGLDVGAMIRSQKLYLGATLRNLIPQRFDYSDIGKNCDSKTTDGERRDCQVAANFAGRVSLSDSYELEPQLMVEAAYQLHKSGLHVFGSIEANSVENVSGGEYQWAVAGLAFTGPWWLPSAELSYIKNLAGQKLDMIAVGAQFFKVVNLQLSVSPDKAELDGDTVNRAAALSISFLTTF